MRGRTVLIVAWVAGVLAASLVTWRAIDAAGQQILSDSYPSNEIIDLAGSGTTPTSDHTGNSKPKSTPTKTPTPSATETSQPTQTTSTPQPQSVTRTWRGNEGYIVASCTGPRMAIGSVTPNNGYKAEIDGGQDSPTKVHFEGRGEKGGESTILVTCSGGTPKYSDSADH